MKIIITFLVVIANHLSFVSRGQYGLLTNYPETNGSIYAMAKDTATNILYIGGNFTDVDGQSRNNIAAIDSNGVLTSWNPDVNGTITSIVVDGNNILIGGYFTTINGTTRNRIGGINKFSPTFTTLWNPNADGAVLCMIKNGTTIFIGGRFNSVGGQVRSKFAGISASSGSATSHNVSINLTSQPSSCEVRAIDVNGGIFIGGNFNQVGGLTRPYIAKLNINDGTVLSAFAPSAPNGPVNTMAIYATSGVSTPTIIIGGEFLSTFGGPTIRYRLVQLNTTDGSLAINGSSQPNVYAPSYNGVVYAVKCPSYIMASNPTLISAGVFTNVSGQTRRGLAELNIVNSSTSSLYFTSWISNLTGGTQEGRAIVLDGDYVYIGGTFTTADGVSRNNLAVYKKCTVPNLSNIQNDSVCDSGSVILTAQASSGVVNWYDVASGGTALYTGNTFNTPNISTTTLYYAEAEDLCISNRTAIEAKVNISPTSVVTQNGVQLTATPVSGATYNWYNCTLGLLVNDTNQSFNIPNNDTYALIVTKNGCSDTSSCYSAATTSIGLWNTSSVKVFPNPFQDYIQLSNVEKGTTITLFNSCGVNLLKQTTANETYLLPAYGLKKGLYILTLEHKLGRSTYKLIKE